MEICNKNSFKHERNMNGSTKAPTLQPSSNQCKSLSYMGTNTMFKPIYIMEEI
jgi:hypothetical protein